MQTDGDVGRARAPATPVLRRPQLSFINPKPGCKRGHGVPYTVNCPRCSTEASIRANARRRAQIAQYKLSVGCMDCGYDEWPEALDFDHREGEVKEFDISHASRSRDAILNEMAKCDVVCANCHRHRTWLRAQGGDAYGRDRDRTPAGDEA